jgi:hypothetical protein
MLYASEDARKPFHYLKKISGKFIGLLCAKITKFYLFLDEIML